MPNCLIGAPPLLLFEHVHGESRDRDRRWSICWRDMTGRAPELDSRELPDHLPLYLEYLMRSPRRSAGDQDIAPILALLSASSATAGKSLRDAAFTPLIDLANTAIDQQKWPRKS